MHVYFNEILSRAFKERVLRVREDLVSDVGTVQAARYSAFPPSEEARTLCRSTFPLYVSGSLTTNTASAIARIMADMNRIPIAELHPLLYALGHANTIERVQLAAPECVGMVAVAEEFLPLSLFGEPRENHDPHPRLQHWAIGLNRPSFCMYEGLQFSPTFLSRSLEGISPHAQVEIPPAETTRAGEDGSLRALECFRSNYRYAGGVRLATPEEINEVFRQHFLPGSWYGFPAGYPVTDYFSLLGIANQFTYSQEHAPVTAVTPAVSAAPTGANATNVVGRSRPVSAATRARRDRDLLYNSSAPRPGSMRAHTLSYGTVSPASPMIDDEFETPVSG